MAYVLITGATGYLGHALVRERSVGRMPTGAEEFAGDALNARSVATALKGCDTLVHLVGRENPGNPGGGTAFGFDVEGKVTAALVRAVESPEARIRIVEVLEIRRVARQECRG